ncbi:hypothetical protein SDC9_168244 [bioreactor metagenome]|uniref:Uncharacterized protein n=1 Tax=bioreactor metagenome TaxID=1076179 RepID=A0A645G2K7_9ZZZZ
MLTGPGPLPPFGNGIEPEANDQVHGMTPKGRLFSCIALRSAANL